MPLPVDFEKLVKLPDANGYPYSLKAEDLMRNFAWCDLLPSETSDALRIELTEEPGKTAQHTQRRLSVAGSSGTVTTVNVLVVENGVFKTGDFLISGSLTTV